MAVRLAALLPRAVLVAVIWVLATAAFTLAADSTIVGPSRSSAKSAAAKPTELMVPSVTGQAYVFAKGILEDAGFSWRVVGPVKGYAANLVTVQNPAPGVEVLDNGAPRIELRLERNPEYAERGLPENTSSFAGSELRLADDPLPAAEQEPAAPAEDEPDPEPKEDEGGEAKSRTPDFVAPGAPPEPTDEMPLPDRARLLKQRIDAAPKPTPKLVDWWLYQHAWIVTGAEFGWHKGAEALRTLIRVDESIEARWGFGARSTAAARRVLAEVERKASE